jgi:hypothetical protein
MMFLFSFLLLFFRFAPVRSLLTFPGVHHFPPQTPDPPFIRKEDLRTWLLTKCINGERIAIDEVKTFSDKIAYTRQQLLKDLIGEETSKENTKEKKILITID